MARLIWVFAGCTCHFVGFVTRRLKFSETSDIINRAAPSEFLTYRLCEQWRFRRACASAQSRQNLRCSLIQTVSQDEPSDRKPDPWPLWMAGHAQLKFVMTECSKTQIRLTGPNTCWGLLMTLHLSWLPAKIPKTCNLKHLFVKPWHLN